MAEFFTLIGLLFIVFSILMLPMLIRGNAEQKREACISIVIAMGVMIAFGVGSWATGAVFLGAGWLIDKVLGVGGFFVGVLILVAGLATVGWLQKRARGEANKRRK